MKQSKRFYLTIFEELLLLNFYIISIIFVLNLLLAFFKSDCSAILKTIEIEHKLYWVWVLSLISWMGVKIYKD